MKPQDFIAKWRAVELKERSASQSHFNDLCALLGVLDPISADPKGEFFTFEKGASKTSGGEGWADVWRKECFAWEYKGKNKDLDKAFAQIQDIAGARWTTMTRVLPHFLENGTGRIINLAVMPNMTIPSQLVRAVIAANAAIARPGTCFTIHRIRRS